MKNLNGSNENLGFWERIFDRASRMNPVNLALVLLFVIALVAIWLLANKFV